MMLTPPPVGLLLPLLVTLGLWGAVPDSPFSLEVKRDAPMPLEGPCPLTLLVTYRGGDDVRVPLLDGRSTFVLRLDGPDGWVRRDQMAFPPAMGGPSMRPLRRGESMAGVVYLHDYFSRLTQGKSTLQMALVIWPEVAGRSERVIFEESLGVDLVAEGQESLGQRIGEVAAQVAIADPGTDRLRLYESLRSLSHRDLIPLFLRALADPSAESASQAPQTAPAVGFDVVHQFVIDMMSRVE